MQLGHSPDSDDAFMFYGLAKNLVDSEGLEFEHILRDIQTLNEWSKEGKLECTAISVHAYAYVHDRYAILSHGASMGDGYGPMIVTKTPMTPQEVAQKRIAIPGKMTSAYLALQLFLADLNTEQSTPNTQHAMPITHHSPLTTHQFPVLPFDKIQDAVHSGEVEAGLIIHEGQLTHKAEGLHTVLDLGDWWKGETGLPLPLGVNAIRKDLPKDVQERASRALKRSIVYGLEHRQAALGHAMQFARDMELKTADTFVGMYVNNWTIDLGEPGKQSIRLFLKRGSEAGLIPILGEVEFVD